MKDNDQDRSKLFKINKSRIALEVIGNIKYCNQQEI